MSNFSKFLNLVFLGSLAVFKGPVRFRKVGGTGRIHSHKIPYDAEAVGPSYGQNNERRHEY